MADARLYEKACAWAERRRLRIAGRNPWVVAVNVARNSADDRVGGLAAEMAFWAMLSFFPLIVTMAAVLGYAERFIGPEPIERGRHAVVSALSVVFSGELLREVVDPFVAGLLTAERGGVALTSLAVALFLASRVFTATIRALDLAYRVPERRGLLVQRLLALALAVGFIIVSTTTLLLMVVGPMLGAGRELADRLGLGRAFELTWTLARWPFLVAAMIAFLAVVYRYGPAAPNRLRDCLPGAVVGVVAWLLATVGLRVYLAAGGGGTPEIATEDQAVAVVGRVVGALVAAMLWVFLAGVAILAGGELNAELARQRPVLRSVRDPDASGTMPADG